MRSESWWKKSQARCTEAIDLDSLFLICSALEMQKTLDFGIGDDLAWIRRRLLPVRKYVVLHPPLSPTGQLVKSMISGVTRDPVSDKAYMHLRVVYPEWLDLLAAPVEDIHDLICPVEFASRKARDLQSALHDIAVNHADFDLSFLRNMPVSQALAWLQTLKGVGPKVAASTLNFSTLNAAAFVADTHVLRVLRRFGIAGGGTAKKTADIMLSALDGWSAEELTELHVFIKVLGQTLCRPCFSACEKCPLRTRCAFRLAGSDRSSRPLSPAPCI